jgi:hypothetical protein
VIEAVLFATLAALLYHLGMGFVLFLVPVQVALARRGRRGFYTAALLAFVLIVAVKLWLVRRNLAEALPFTLAETVAVAALLGGLALVQLPELEGALAGLRLARVPRLLAATALAGLVSVPVILRLRADEAFTAGLRELFGELAAVLNSALRGAEGLGSLGPQGPLGESAGAAAGPVSAESLMQAVREILSRSFLFSYFVVLAFAWRAGSALGARSVGRAPGFRPLKDFRLPDGYIWPLIASLAVVALNEVVSVGALELAAWNLLLIMALLYGLSGIGILRFLLSRYRLPPGLRWLLVGAMIVMALTPRLNLAVAVLVPGLGVSEIWVNYRKERSEFHQS